MAFPKIVWPTGGANTITFTWQPLQLTPVHKEAVRHDSIASAGDQQSVLERIENLQILRMHFIGTAALENNWAPFFDSALAGTAFDYYPDAAVGTFTTYHLTALAIEPQWDYNDPTEAVYRFELAMRKQLP